MQTIPRKSGIPAIARGIARLEPDDLEEGNLTLPLSMSLWLKESLTELDAAARSMMELRRALVMAAGLDLRSEPTPLLAGDERAIVLHLAAYISGLVERAAMQAQLSRVDLVEEALELIAA